jgi:hypothetical protein
MKFEQDPEKGWTLMDYNAIWLRILSLKYIFCLLSSY